VRLSARHHEPERSEWPLRQEFAKGLYRHPAIVHPRGAPVDRRLNDQAQRTGPPDLSLDRSGKLPLRAGVAAARGQTS
jgi:hypothetical protein